jgi:hypothetical protein
LRQRVEQHRWQRKVQHKAPQHLAIHFAEHPSTGGRKAQSDRQLDRPRDGEDVEHGGVLIVFECLRVESHRPSA